MKCPKCNNNHKKKAGMKCSCGYNFTLNPSLNSGWSDNKFLSLIRAASRNDTVFFTKNQLYYYWCRKKMNSAFVDIGCSVVVGFVILGILTMIFDFSRFLVIFSGAVVIVIFLWARFIQPKLKNIFSKNSTELFENVLRRWKNSKKIEKFIDKIELHEPPPEWQEPDIYNYGVERILVVEHDYLVDLFVKNGWHAENRTLVIGESTYPEYLLPRMKKILDERLDLPIFILHDSTTEGLGMEGRVRQSKIPINSHKIINLGLTKDDVKNMKGYNRMNPKKRNYAMPIDCIPYQNLAAMITQATLAGVTIAYLLQHKHNPDGGSDGGNGGLGGDGGGAGRGFSDFGGGDFGGGGASGDFGGDGGSG